MSEPMTGDRTFRDDVVRIASLTVRTPMIDGYTFVNCTIIGPAVLAILHDVGITHCTFEADLNAMFWDIDPDIRPVVLGAVGVQNSTFSACTFQAIGFAGPPALREAMETGVSG